jgi:hypothetical protein
MFTERTPGNPTLFTGGMTGTIYFLFFPIFFNGCFGRLPRFRPKKKESKVKGAFFSLAEGVALLLHRHGFEGC